MDLRKYFKKINIKTEKLNRFATNVITDKNFSYNPFQSALSQTYVWIEDEKKKRIKL